MKRSSVQRRLAFMFCVLIVGTFVGSCASGPPIDPGVSSRPMPFGKAVGSLANEMIDVIRDRQGMFERPPLLVIEPFRDQDTGEVLKASMTIETIFTKMAKKNDVTVRRLNRQTLGKAKYFIEGAIKWLEPSGKEASGTRQYKISAKLYALSTKEKLHKVTVIAEGDSMGLSPISLYEDSPIFLRDWQKDRGVSKASILHGHSLSDSRLNARAVMAEAETAYDQGQYEIAMELFKEMAKKEDRRALPFYAGMYATSMKMGRLEEAESSFGKIVQISVEQHGVLTVKFLFEVNATDFFGGEKQQRIYNMWLRQIGHYFEKSNRCMKISGHTSPTGSESWNNELSLRRAQTIRRLLKKTFKNVERQSKAVGRGFRDNIIGIASDDARDALDRRVEIIPIGCEKI